MQAYCKTCRQSHAIWNRLNDSMICGRCGTRVRGSEFLSVQLPLTSHPDRPATAKRHKPVRP